MTADDAAALAAVAQSAAPVAGAAPPPPPAAAAAPTVDLAPLGVDAYDLLARAREIAYAVAQARSQRRPDLVAGRVTGDLARTLEAEAAAMTEEHRHHVLSFLEVDRAEITAAGHGADGDSVTVRMHMSGEEYELADAGLDVVDGSRTPHSWSEDWVLTRASGGAEWLASSSRRVEERPEV